MTTFLIITAIIAMLFLIIKLSNKKNDDSSSVSSPSIKYVSWDNLLKRANEKFIVRDYKTAVAIADKILLLHPDNYGALTVRANSLAALNFNLEAIEDYERALNIDSSDPNIYGLLGLTYQKIGDIDNGQKNLKISIQKGLKFYEMNYDILLSASDGVRQAMIRKGQILENLKRRNSNDFVDNLSSVDRNEFKQAVKNQIKSLEGAISLDPNNEEIKKLYNFAKEQIDD